MSVEVKLEKQKVIDEIKAKLVGAKAVVVINYMGITVLEADDMRKRLREENIDYTVYKNTLVKRAIAGTEFEGLADVLDGPSGFAISKDEATAPARVLNVVMKEYKKMEFKAGVIEGVFMDQNAIVELADIPSREVLIAKFMGSIQSPVSKLVRTIQAIADASEGEAVEA
ncbi:MAG: 50S ribosomal protein L10 [Peptostreptococcaceae bacterium]|nr:50S ribosomal protein L10 [Peptostreptococcaceae bacterium]